MIVKVIVLQAMATEQHVRRNFQTQVRSSLSVVNNDGKMCEKMTAERGVAKKSKERQAKPTTAKQAVAATCRHARSVGAVAV